MAMFQSFRNSYGFTYYGENRTPVTWDIQLITVAYICVLATVSMLIATLGIRGRERWYYAVRAFYALSVGSIILVSLVGQDWLKGSANIQSHYLYRNDRPFIGSLHINVGLYRGNITLDGYYDGESGRGYAFYSESIWWPDYGQERETFNHFLTKGLPDPVLKVAEYLTFDSGGLRWGRAFHKSGYFCSALLWCSFAFWIVSNVLLCSVVLYGAYMFLLTGLTMVLACVTYHACQCPLPLVIMFNNNSLRVSYGWCYWLILTAGCVTCVLAVLLIVADHMVHEMVSEFFQLEKLVEEDFYDIDNMHFPSVSIVPGSPSIERAGSIFLATCRLPKQIKYNGGREGYLSGQAAVFSNSSSGRPDNNHVNSHGSSEEQEGAHGRTGHRNSVTFKLQYVDEDGELCLRDIEASMYSLHEDGNTDNSEGVSIVGSVDGSTHNQVRDENDKRAAQKYENNITQEKFNEVCANIQGKRWHDGIYKLPTEEYPMENISRSMSFGDLAQEDQIIFTAEPSSSVQSPNRLQVPGTRLVVSRTEHADEDAKANASDGRQKGRLQDGRLSSNSDTAVNIH